MGFLSKASGILGGGGGKSSSTTQSGYGALPSFQKAAWQNLNTAQQQFVNPIGENGLPNAANIARFTPLAETADESRAFDLLRQGFTPTAQGLRDDLEALQNPYNEFVVSEINRQANGQNSILKQALNSAGQLNSNRSILGANDIDLSRMNTIGTFLNDNYNQNLNYALTALPALRAADATGLLSIGEQQRALDYQTNQAPVAAAQTQAGLLAGFPNSSIATQTQSSGGGLLSTLGSVGGLVSGIGALGGGGLLSSANNYLGQKVGSLLSNSSYGPWLPYGSR